VSLLIEDGRARYSPNDVMEKTSRHALQLAAAALAVPIIYSFIEPHRVQVKHFDVVLDNLPDAADGLRVVQLSDLHVSAISSAAFLQSVVQTTNELNADLIVMTGDYISRRNSYFPLSGARQWSRPVMEYAERMAALVAELRAGEGILAVPGNHDVANDNGDAIAALLSRSGVEMLTNRNTRVRGLAIAGVDDLRAGRPNYRTALKGISPDEAQIVLSHNPRVAPRLRNRNALILAGHTHAGQVHLPFTNYRRRPSDMKGSPYFQGWYSVGRAQLYVNSGLGSVHFPMRFGCPPEIVVFTLRKGDDKA
jgi:predicted MPP superfamily phosphohydrolase